MKKLWFFFLFTGLLFSGMNTNAILELTKSYRPQPVKNLVRNWDMASQNRYKQLFGKGWERPLPKDFYDTVDELFLCVANAEKKRVLSFLSSAFWDRVNERDPWTQDRIEARKFHPEKWEKGWVENSHWFDDKFLPYVWHFLEAVQQGGYSKNFERAVSIAFYPGKQSDFSEGRVEISGYHVDLEITGCDIVMKKEKDQWKIVDIWVHSEGE